MSGFTLCDVRTAQFEAALHYLWSAGSLPTFIVYSRTRVWLKVSINCSLDRFDTVVTILLDYYTRYCKFLGLFNFLVVWPVTSLLLPHTNTLRCQNVFPRFFRVALLREEESTN